MKTSSLLPAGLLLSVLACASCATAGKPGIPGIQKMARPEEPIPTKTILLALKTQLADAIAAIKADQGAKPDDTLTKAFTIGVGSGTFTGSVQIVNDGNASLSAVIPFTGYADSKLGPTLGFSGSATNVQSTALTFDIDPDLAAASVQAAAPGNIDPATFIKDGLLAAYDSVKFLAANPRAPSFSFTTVELAVEFTVVRKFEAGIGDTIIMMPAPDLDSLSPGLGGSRERTGVYKLELKIPLGIDAPADSRRLITHYPLADGRTIAVEEPYTDKRYDELRAGGPRPAFQPEAAPRADDLLRPGGPLGPRLKSRGI